MHKLIVLFLLLLSSGFAFANDGVFYASGDMLFPMKKTSIALRKEVLTITKKGDSMLVDVYFEFENPDTTQKLIVGFVTPPGSGDVGGADNYAYSDTSSEYAEYEGEPSLAFVNNFTVTLNEQKLAATAKLLGKSGFKLPKKSFATEYDFVYYFTATFKPGTNKIHHTYWMPMAGSVMEAYTGYYRLTTGTSWANKQIDDFTLNLHVDDNEKFYITRTFRKNKKPADWKIVGKGKITKGWIKYLSVYDGADNEPMTFVKLTSGYLQLVAKNFRPEYDLVFGKERKMEN
jgi:hypothetical protein